jgi:hypothetical protein
MIKALVHMQMVKKIGGHMTGKTVDHDFDGSHAYLASMLNCIASIRRALVLGSFHSGQCCHLLKKMLF